MSLNLILINVSFPYYYQKNLEEYSLYIGKLISIKDELDSNHALIMQDFKAGLRNQLHSEWLECIAEDDVIFF